MTGEEMLREIYQREYYDCAWFTIKIGIIVACLLSIAGHVKELWQALASCF